GGRGVDARSTPRPTTAAGLLRNAPHAADHGEAGLPESGAVGKRTNPGVDGLGPLAARGVVQQQIAVAVAVEIADLHLPVGAERSEGQDETTETTAHCLVPPPVHRVVEK